MSWIDTKFEIEMYKYFVDTLGDIKGKELYDEYSSVRNAMEKDNFFGEIKGKEPNLSDHSEKHIQDVFERAYKVIGADKFRNVFSVYEIYCLAIMILFHDVGNIYGRTGHESVEKIAEIYLKYRPNWTNYRDEKRIITTGASAHSGATKEGSKDTLKMITEGSLKGNKIKLPELAAILRFSDELAEGKQRTCSFMIEHGLLEKESEIFHNYAQVTDIEIDRELERISITFDVDIPINFDKKAQEEFSKLIVFTFYRVIKLDIERRYTKNYSKIIDQFRFVTIQYNFTQNGIPIDFELNKIEFENPYPIPGGKFEDEVENAKKIFSEKDDSFDTKKIIDNINSALSN